MGTQYPSRILHLLEGWARRAVKVCNRLNTKNGKALVGRHIELEMLTDEDMRKSSHEAFLIELD
jgi:hypothetical protein